MALAALCGPLLAACAIGCSGNDVVFIPLSVGFLRPASASPESQAVSSITLVLSAPAPHPVTVAVRARDGAASSHDRCGTRDYSLPDQTVRIEPGATEATAGLRHLDDASPELDEELTLEIAAADGATIALGEHRHTIEDDDRSLLADVKADFGALGDGRNDDTVPLQRAFDRAALSDRGVVLLPPGTYVVRTLNLPAGVSLYGYDATLTRASDQPRDQESLVIDYEGDGDSDVTLLQGLTLDGNRAEQDGGFANWEYRNANLIHARAEPTRPGRVRLTVEDVALRNSGASGLLLGTNTDTSLCDVIGDEVFTDLLHLSGGNSRLQARSLVATATTGTTGVAIKATEPGFGESLTLNVQLEDVVLESGDLQISLDQDSELDGVRVNVARAPLFVRALRSRVHFVDSSFVSGPALYEYNRIVAPTDVTFERTLFVVSESPEPTVVLQESDRELRALDIVWNDVQLALEAGAFDTVREVRSDQRLSCIDCSFALANDIEVTDQVFAVGTSQPNQAEGDVRDSGQNNRVLLSAPSLGPGFAGPFAAACVGCTEE